MIWMVQAAEAFMYGNWRNKNCVFTIQSKSNYWRWHFIEFMVFEWKFWLVPKIQFQLVGPAENDVVMSELKWNEVKTKFKRGSRELLHGEYILKTMRERHGIICQCVSSMHHFGHNYQFPIFVMYNFDMFETYSLYA